MESTSRSLSSNIPSIVTIEALPDIGIVHDTAPIHSSASPTSNSGSKGKAATQGTPAGRISNLDQHAESHRRRIQHELDKLEIVKSKIGVYPDWPSPGVVFRDMMPVLNDADTLRLTVELLINHIKINHEPSHITHIVGIDARGFILGAILAEKLHVGFVPVRKRGKLPGETAQVSYSLEYGEPDQILEIQSASFASYLARRSRDSGVRDREKPEALDQLERNVEAQAERDQKRLLELNEIQTRANLMNQLELSDLAGEAAMAGMEGLAEVGNMSDMSSVIRQGHLNLEANRGGRKRNFEQGIPSILIVDDLLATGGTMTAACKLVEQIGGSVYQCLVFMELTSLKGRHRVENEGFAVDSLLQYD